MSKKEKNVKFLLIEELGKPKNFLPIIAQKFLLLYFIVTVIFFLFWFILS